MANYHFENMCFLVADDNARMRKLVREILQAFGASTIEEAPNGETAWQILCEKTIDVAIIDWQMEEMSGPDLVCKLRNDPGTPNPFLPVIMLTGHAHIDNVHKARDCGANEYLVKPIAVRAFYNKIVSLIENPRPFIRTGTYFGPCRRRHPTNRYTGPDRREIIATNIG